ncbi:MULTISPECIES: cupin domain-containing protein [unclassified Streptomyces]|uniref:cupin domain-containing protein n=1 Tax=unclassified Streptomyces TaxID=2593676 RepID=UPI00386A18B4|nr:cupin domain-containing protein [Streptomyces sp. NBC_00827]
MHVPPDAGKSVFLVGDTYTVLLNAAETGGNLSRVEAIVPAKASPPMHTQHQEAESFLVMDGELVITAENEEYEVSAGGVVYVPKRTSHKFRNRSDTRPARMILLFTPGGLDGMFPDIGTPGVRVSSPRRSTTRTSPRWEPPARSTTTPSARGPVAEVDHGRE